MMHGIPNSSCQIKKPPEVQYIWTSEQRVPHIWWIITIFPKKIVKTGVPLSQTHPDDTEKTRATLRVLRCLLTNAHVVADASYVEAWRNVRVSLVDRGTLQNSQRWKFSLDHRCPKIFVVKMGHFLAVFHNSPGSFSWEMDRKWEIFYAKPRPRYERDIDPLDPLDPWMLMALSQQLHGMIWICSLYVTSEYIYYGL